MNKNIKNEIIRLIKNLSNKKIKDLKTNQLIVGDLLDSFDMIKFISALEEKFKVKFNTKDLSIYNFEKIDRITKLVRSKMK